MAGPMGEANAAMLNSMQNPDSDSQTAVDVWSALASAFERIAAETSNPEVKAAATATHADIVAVRDAMQKVYVDGNMLAMGDYALATDRFNTSYSALMELCQ